jgi:hypothetical protein
MNTFVHLPLQESMAQCSAGKYDQWQGNMTVLVVNDGIITLISIFSSVIHLMIEFDVDWPWADFRQDVQ